MRGKHLDQGYPLDVINGEFRRALEIDKKDLIFNTDKKKKKRNIIAPLVITHNPRNPNFKQWIQEEINILHQDQEVFPKKYAVTCQGKNVSEHSPG